jgi:ADP-ribosylglycohydrolase
VGDALGAGVEFMSLGQIRHGFGLGGVSEMTEAYGRVGAITDDTQMTLFTLEGLIRADNRQRERGICDPIGVVHHAYLRWLWTQGESPRKNPYANGEDWPDGILAGVPELRSCRAPGNTCLSALRTGVIGTPEAPLNNSKGCGGVMRAAPVGFSLFASRDGFELGSRSAAITHGHPSGYLPAGALAVMISCLLDGATMRDAVERALAKMRERPAHEESVTALNAAVRLAQGGAPSAERVELLGGGWVGEEALAIAVYAALVADGFEDGVLLAVNHGGDCDSTAAIAGNLLGASLGVDVIPDRWLEQLELRELITTLADDAAAHHALDWPPPPIEDWDRYPGW